MQKETVGIASVEVKSYHKCSICGVSSLKKRVTYFYKYQMYLCSKHYTQLKRFGVVTDPSPKTIRDKNEIIIKDDHAEIELTNHFTGEKEYALIDLDDVDRVMEHKWHLHIQPNRYNYKTVQCTINKKLVKMHRFIMNYNGNDVVDHINRNTLDNRKCNLHIITATRNKQNVNPVGVYQRKNGRWSAAFKRENKMYHIGTYDSKEEAQAARKNAVREYDLTHYGDCFDDLRGTTNARLGENTKIMQRTGETVEEGPGLEVRSADEQCPRCVRR